MYKFGVDATNASKGVAIILVLWHHLFIQHPEYGFIVLFSAKVAKVSVTIFVILSGYGLSKSVSNLNLFSFYKKRLARLYINYWLIAMIFIPIGVFFMDRSLVSVYGDHEYVKLVIQMLGLHMFTAVGSGYNGTWWFISLMIVLYLLFPFINKIMKKYPYIFLLLSFILLLLPSYSILYYGFSLLQFGIFPFAIGIYMANKNGFSIILSWLKKMGNIRFFVLTLLVILVSIQRSYGIILFDLKIDWLLAILIILLTTEIIIWSKKLQIVLSFIGIHSYNIFLFHTFIHYYYWGDFIYSFNNPIIIFFVFLLLSILISIVIEFIKKHFSAIFTASKNRVYSKILD